MNLDMFLRMNETHTAGVVPRDEALQVIKDRGLVKVTLGSFREGSTLYFMLDHLKPWAWDTELMSRELHPYNICLSREDLEFHAILTKSFPLLILKRGWGNAVVVAPTEFKK